MRKQDKIKNIRNLSKILDDYNNVLDEQKLNMSEETQEKINILQIESQDYIKQKENSATANVFAVAFILLFLGVSLVFNFLSSRENDILQKDNIEKKNIIAKLQWSDSLFNQIMKIKSNYNDNFKGVFFYRNRDGEIITYEELKIENDSLFSKEIDMANENNRLQEKLNLIRKNYNITIKETDKYITTEAPQLDSALLLLPFYRNKIKYDNENKTWIIYSK